MDYSKVFNCVDAVQRLLTDSVTSAVEYELTKKMSARRTISFSINQVSSEIARE